MPGDGSVCAGRSDDKSERDKLLFKKNKTKPKNKITFPDLSPCWRSLLRRLNFTHSPGGGCDINAAKTLGREVRQSGPAETGNSRGTTGDAAERNGWMEREGLLRVEWRETASEMEAGGRTISAGTGARDRRRSAGYRSTLPFFLPQRRRDAGKLAAQPLSPCSRTGITS